LFNKSDGTQINASFIEVTGLFRTTTAADGKVQFVAIPYKSSSLTSNNYFVVGLPIDGGDFFLKYLD